MFTHCKAMRFYSDSIIGFDFLWKLQTPLYFYNIWARAYWKPTKHLWEWSITTNSAVPKITFMPRFGTCSQVKASLPDFDNFLWTYQQTIFMYREWAFQKNRAIALMFGEKKKKGPGRYSSIVLGNCLCLWPSITAEKDFDGLVDLLQEVVHFSHTNETICAQLL